MTHETLLAEPVEPAPMAAAEDEARDEQGLRTDSLSDSVLLLLGLTLVQRMVGFGRGIIFCRWLSPEELGRWDLAFGFLSLAAPLAVFGVPGSFGRYVEHYRKQGFLRTFLTRTGAITCVFALVGVFCVVAGAPLISRLVFGGSASNSMIFMLAFTLGAVIVYNALNMLFTALRMYRIVSAMQFASSLGFALIGVGLLAGWRLTAESAIVAFGLSYTIVVLASVRWLRRIWKSFPDESGSLAHRTLWSKLAPFALWLWVVNWLSNMFDVADRYLLLHLGGLDATEACELIGQYHSARILPVLFLGLSELFAAMITPHLSHDWEHGKKDEVVRRLNLFVKLFGFATFAASIAMIIGAPVLFNFVLQHKFAAGMALLPLAMTCCGWLGVGRVAENYLWCLEKAWLASAALLVALSMNLCLNVYLIPRYGLLGAVLSTTLANLVYVLLIYFVAWRQGMRWDRGSLCVLLLPLTLCLGTWAPAASIATFFAVLLCGVFTNLFLSENDREQLADMAKRYGQRIKAVLERRRARKAEPKFEKTEAGAAGR